MKRTLSIAALAIVTTWTAGCSATSTIENPSAEVTAPTSINSTIIAAMENSYEERPELPIDPCQDRFIELMDKLGFQLSQAVEPNTLFSYGYWHTSCVFQGTTSGMSISTTNSPNLAAQLTPGDATFADAYKISIGGRFAVVSPSADPLEACWIGMETSFGAINVSGGNQIGLGGDRENACEVMIEFLEQLEPLLGD